MWGAAVASLCHPLDGLSHLILTETPGGRFWVKLHVIDGKTEA